MKSVVLATTSASQTMTLNDPGTDPAQVIVELIVVLLKPIGTAPATEYCTFNVGDGTQSAPTIGASDAFHLPSSAGSMIRMANPVADGTNVGIKIIASAASGPTVAAFGITKADGRLGFTFSPMPFNSLR